MLQASLIFADREWILPGIVVLAITAIVVGRGYWKSPASRFVKVGAFALKMLGVGILVLCLLEPEWTGERIKKGANYFAILVDNSRGMQIKDLGASRSRGGHLQALLRDGTGQWRESLEEVFQVRPYIFDGRLHAVRDFNDLKFDGRASALNSALHALAERYVDRPLAGILVFSDGNATDAVDGGIAADGLPPVYPVVIGTDDPISDIAVTSLIVNRTAFEDAPTTVQGDVRVQGFAGRRVTGTLMPIGGDPSAPSPSAPDSNPMKSGSAVDPDLSPQTISVSDEDETLRFRYQFRPESSGVSFYRFEARLEDETGDEPSSESDSSAEATWANNRRVAVVDRGGGPYRLLYVGGRPNWEFKFLNRGLREDDQIQMSALIRIADRAPRFEFRGRPGESSNPLYRGFDKKDDLTEQYDQAVMTRLNTRDEAELVGGFPKTAEELYEYSAIILDDLEAKFFTRDQQSLIQKYVSERGGGLLALGGMNSFHSGGYDRTPVGDILPVYVGRPPVEDTIDAARLELTAEGELEPWVRLRKTEELEEARLRDMPAFRVVNVAPDIKPGATVYWTARDAATGKKYPALIMQRYGAGRVGAVAIGDLWRWQMHAVSGQGDLGKAWRQLVRRLIADVPAPVQAEALPVPGDPNQAVAVRVRVKDMRFWPKDDAGVTLSVIEVPTDGGERDADPSAPPVRIAAEPVGTEPGLYEATYIPRRTGGYGVEAVAVDSQGLTLGTAEAGWSSDPAAEEFRSLKPDRRLLETLATQTGGEIVAEERLNSFVADLPAREAPVTETWSYPLWHTPLMFLVGLACLVAEWGIRRTKGLA